MSTLFNRRTSKKTSHHFEAHQTDKNTETHTTKEETFHGINHHSSVAKAQKFENITESTPLLGSISIIDNENNYHEKIPRFKVVAVTDICSICL